MAQYKVGTVALTNGSTIVDAVDPDNPGTLAQQEWLTEIAVGDLFYVADDAVVYTVLDVISDTQLTLTAPYQGATTVPSGTPLAGVSYAIHRDFTTNYAFPIVSQGDIGIPVMVQRMTIDFDAELKDLDDRVTALEP
jgi:hypothetical protein